MEVNGKPATMEQLDGLAAEIGRVSKDVTVLVRSDETAELRYALKAMDICRKHGLNKIRLQTR
jgi:biopolymer transport protein ExbD